MPAIVKNQRLPVSRLRICTGENGCGCSLDARPLFLDAPSVSTEAGLFGNGTIREQAGRLKVGGPLSDWFEERRIYHRKAARIVKTRDDLAYPPASRSDYDALRPPCTSGDKPDAQRTNSGDPFRPRVAEITPGRPYDLVRRP